MKYIFVLSIAIFLSVFCAAQNEPKYEKTEHLIKTAGINGYAGWDLTITYKVNSKGVPESDTVFTINCNSAAYTQVVQTFEMFSSNEKTELIAFVKNLDSKLIEMPDDTNIDDGALRLQKKKKTLTITRTDSGRSDTYTYYSDMVAKKIWKAIATLK